jgi:hypothetical protein
MEYEEEVFIVQGKKTSCLGEILCDPNGGRRSLPSRQMVGCSNRRTRTLARLANNTQGWTDSERLAGLNLAIRN